MNTFPMLRYLLFASAGLAQAMEAVAPVAPVAPAPIVVESPVLRDPFTEAFALPVAQRITAQAQQTVDDLAKSLAPNNAPEQLPDSAGQKVTAALQPLHVILRGSTPAANGVWIALVEEPTSKRTLVVKVGQTLNLSGHHVLVTKIEATTIWLQAGEKTMVFSQ